MLSDSLPIIGSKNRKLLGGYYNKSADFDKKFTLHWSPQEESKLLYRQKYVAASKSVPNRNRGLARYRISRSLNFDTTLHSTSSDNSSFEADKHLSRSAKIMRALNLNSPTFYGKTKIKKALNFNSTPSPKRFIRTGKSIKKAGTLNAKSSTKLNKVLDYDENPTDSPHSSIVFTSPESMDENQNETPSQRRFKAHTSLTYSTPNPEQRLDSPVPSSFSPLLRSGLKNKIDNIIYIGTPNLTSLRSSKTKLKYNNDISARTPRNLLSDFHDEEADRPCTPENVIAIVPESTSAIKRSHKKERLRLAEKHSSDLNTSTSNSKLHSIGGMWSPDIVHDNVVSQLDINNTDLNSDSLKVDNSKKKCKNRTRASLCSADGNASDTGSIFDYAEECKNLSKESEDLSNELMEQDSLNESQDMELGVDLEDDENKFHDKVNVMAQTSKDDSFSGEIQELNLSNQGVSLEENDAEINDRPITPEVIQQAATSPQAAVTPENRINYLRHVIEDSIKKSHRKIKDNNRKRLFSPQVLHHRLDAMTPGKPLYSACTTNGHENITEMKPLIENHDVEAQGADRAVTPERMNSSRLLLSQYSSVKKSHRKGKHNKMVSSFKRRQEYFNHDMETVSNGKNKTSSFEESRNKTQSSATSNHTSNAKESSAESSSSEVYPCESSSPDKSSPSKRKSATSSDSEAFTPNIDSELDDCDSSKEEFQIFTPLKRRKALLKDASPLPKGYLCVYQVPSGNDDISEEAEADLSRCITPVSSYHRESVELPPDVSSQLRYNRTAENHDEQSQELHTQESSPQTTSGRSTPLNMSTADFYPNIDSIKKSHKKNKRRPQIQRGLLSSMTHSPEKGEEKNVSTSNSMDDLSFENNIDEYRNGDKSKCSIDSDGVMINAQEGTHDVQKPSTSGTDDTSTIKTPPACLRTINYIKLLHSTSIKRSHKKERNRKKIELALHKYDLSDDGSIFGDDNDDKEGSSELGDNSRSDN